MRGTHDGPDKGHPNRQARKLDPANGRTYPAYDCRNGPFWQDDEVVKDLRIAAESTGVAEYIRVMLLSDAQMGDVDIEALCAIASILGIHVSEED